MKKVLVLLVMMMLFNLSNAQKYKIQNIDAYYTFTDSTLNISLDGNINTVQTVFKKSSMTGVDSYYIETETLKIHYVVSNVKKKSIIMGYYTDKFTEQKFQSTMIAKKLKQIKTIKQ